MFWKKIPSNSGLLYVILDTDIIDKARRDTVKLTQELASSGVDIVQLRAKNLSDKKMLSLARKLSSLIHSHRKLFLINDRPDIAYLSRADGVHLGLDDISASDARKLLGPGKVIGKTVHSLSELRALGAEPLDYLSVGPVFATALKPTLKPLSRRSLVSIIGQSKKLTFAIGGITLYNNTSLFELGVTNIVVCRDIILAKSIKKTVAAYRDVFQKFFKKSRAE